MVFPWKYQSEMISGCLAPLKSQDLPISLATLSQSYMLRLFGKTLGCMMRRPPAALDTSLSFYHNNCT